ncbi:unnamed protein product, partial [Vitis vinifera]|uniref:Uncharacterized protein n=1 Tax=Vitis vinifera TaxID=29760 RepID=D7T7Q1_VITVI
MAIGACVIGMNRRGGEMKVAMRMGLKKIRKMGGKFYRALVYRCFTSNFLFINGYGFSPSSTLSTATTITSTTFQCRKPTIFRHPSSHG